LCNAGPKGWPKKCLLLQQREGAARDSTNKTLEIVEQTFYCSMSATRIHRQAQRDWSQFMVLNSQKTLTASTTVASIASAAVLTLVGLCTPYTEGDTRARPGQPARTQSTLPQRSLAGPMHETARAARDSASLPQHRDDVSQH
jgi:hypothetical protein